MFTLSFESAHKVLRAHFTGIFTAQDFADLDDALLRFLAAQANDVYGRIRAIFDLSDIEAIGVSQSKIADRARRPPILRDVRIMVAPPFAGEDFGRTYRQEQRQTADSEPVIVRSLAEAYALLELNNPCFEPLTG
ncbi:MAG TPA: hypothetical protein VMI56_11750 [Reyranella sp.]|nr:hypothetical protein [Reyranella sp.]